MASILPLSVLLVPAVSGLHAADARYGPDWAGIPPMRVIQHTVVDAGALVKAVEALQPGDQLVIAAGRPQE